jgi:UDP-2,3-diacylglucosamine pyrophosphatase LpxH
MRNSKVESDVPNSYGMRHTLVISDIHLCEAEPSDGLWMRYRQKSFSPDSELAVMLDALRTRVRGEQLTLVLNGDIFDFDAPRVVGDESVFHDLPRDAEHAVPAIAAILDDHTVFLIAIGRLVADGHEAVFISGNHDVQLTLPEVRSLVTARVVEAAALALGRSTDELEPALRRELMSRIAFRAWFHKTVDGIVVEHGNQYDPYCSWRYPMAPFGRDGREIQPTMGSLATRLLASRMGYFNPHVDESFMLSMVGYLHHWAKYYMFTSRSLVVAWATGAVRTLWTLVLRRDPERRERRRANIAAAAAETGVSVKTVARHARLFARPAEDRLPIVMRELWLDRAGILLFSLLVAALWYWLVPGGARYGAVLAPALLLAYEIFTPKIPLGETWRTVNRAARRVAKVHRARAVVLGHTHNPEGVWENGVFHGNTGSWSAAYRDIACTKPLFEERPIVWLTTDADRGGELRGGLFAWKDGQFEERVTAGEAPTPAIAPPPTGVPIAVREPQHYTLGTTLPGNAPEAKETPASESEIPPTTASAPAADRAAEALTH